LTRRPLWQHLIGQQRSGLGHAPITARMTKPALFPAERDELFGVARIADLYLLSAAEGAAGGDRLTPLT
jgi:hypothetical protein